VLSNQDQNDLVREMESVITVFEPRLKRVKVRMEPLGDNSRDLRFVIDGLLNVDPAPEPVRFDTVLEIGSGQYEVRGEDGAR
jgi:type VI secretion system protein ImpF